jgi:hypothetical protein
MGGAGCSKTSVTDYNSTYIAEENNLNEMVGVMVVLYICNRDVLGAKHSRVIQNILRLYSVTLGKGKNST